MRSWLASALSLGLPLTLSLACGDDGGQTSAATTSPVTGASATATTATTGASGASSSGSTATDSGTGTDAGSSAGASESSSGGAKFDVGADQDIGGVMDTACTKVDVLFIIDNSPSMYDEQQTMIANFDAFVADMQAALEGVKDYHVGVITTDNYVEEGFLDDSSPTVNKGFPNCRKLGSLVVQGQAGVCSPFASGGNFISEADDLGARFACVANVGEDGDSDERVGDALIEALKPGSQSPGTCNEGFLRPDALLVLVILTDENDSSDTDPVDWYAAVVASKKAPGNAVVMALIWDDSENNCTQDLSESTGYSIEEFVTKFPNHSVGSICDDSYAGFFTAAVPVIDTACDNFEPPG